MVEAGEVVAVFESKQTADMLDNYNSSLAQTRRRSASRIASLLIDAANLEQDHHKALADADKSKLELRTAEVRSKIQAEILALQAEQDEASAEQLTEEVRLSRIADTSEKRVYEIDIEKDERRLSRTMQDMEKMRLRTPVSGLVVVETMFQRDGFSQASAGDTVNPGSTFLRIVDLSKMAVYADINQADAQLVELGSPATIHLDAYPGAAFEGRVAAIGAVASAGQSTGGGGRGGRGGSRGGSSGQWVRQVAVRIEVLSQDERIKPDLSASADILLAAEDQALVVPRSALGEIDGEDTVWVQDGGKFVARQVQVGQLSDTEATIRSGLSAGEVIAAQPVRDAVLARAL
jgi:HlyD family secretion protein